MQNACKTPRSAVADCNDHPQVCVGFCDASAYCAWAGKGLCGDIESGELIADTTRGEKLTRWDLACGGGTTSSGKTQRNYPYGVGFEDGRCNVDTGTTAPTASLEACGTVEYPNVRDLSGNVFEYTGRLIVDDYLVQATARGGYYGNEFGGDPSYGARCDALLLADTIVGGKQSAMPYVGFRCCD